MTWGKADLLIVAGATMVNLALIYGTGFSPGWWGWVLWAGLGVLYAGIKLDNSETQA